MRYCFAFLRWNMWLSDGPIRFEPDTCCALKQDTWSHIASTRTESIITILQVSGTITNEYEVYISLLPYFVRWKKTEIKILIITNVTFVFSNLDIFVVSEYLYSYPHNSFRPALLAYEFWLVIIKMSISLSQLLQIFEHFASQTCTED